MDPNGAYVQHAACRCALIISAVTSVMIGNLSRPTLSPSLIHIRPYVRALGATTASDSVGHLGPVGH